MTVICYKKSLAYKKPLISNNLFQTFSHAGLIFFSGVLLATFSAQTQLDNRLPKSLEGKELLISGTVLGLPETREDSSRFRFSISSISIPSGSKQFDYSPDFKGIIRLGWYQAHQKIIPGEVWQLKVKLKRPSGFSNPGGFDYEKWLFSQRISATGYVRKSKTQENHKLTSAPWWSINAVRQKIHQTIQNNVEDKSSAAVISALVVADRSALSGQQWEYLQKTGTSHLIAISGLHIAVVAGFGFLPIWLLWRLFPRLNERVPLRVAGGFIGVVFAIFYAMLAGFTLPTQRALVMVLVALASLIARRNYPNYNVLAVALIAVLLLDPLATLSVSFWLSFSAVSLILILLNRQLQQPKLNLIKLQLVLSLGMIPLTLLFFDSASLSAPLANFIAIPWVSFITVPLSLIGLVLMPLSSYLSNAIFSLSALSIDWLFKVLAYFVEFIDSPFNLSGLPASSLIIAFIGLLVLLLPKGFPARWLGLFAFLPAILFVPNKPAQGEFHFTLLDVGQGMASVVQTKNHTLVYDVGTRLSNRFDMTKLVVLPFLKGRHVSRIDTLVLSHDDIDHMGSADTLVKSIKVNTVLGSKRTKLKTQAIKPCYAGEHWTWDGVDFEVLSPSKQTVKGDNKVNDNNLSCVIRVSSKNHSLLLTGDIENKVEKQLLTNSLHKLHSTVMTVPHHGSKTSSSDAFVNAVSPELVIVPAGYRNRFKHPKPSIVSRYKMHNIAILDTVTEGAINIRFPVGKPFSVISYRKENQGFWSRR
jgi:competence protein ComEC